jgi:ABC-type sugar transport system substrate-binding protein
MTLPIDGSTKEGYFLETVPLETVPRQTEATMYKKKFLRQGVVAVISIGLAIGGTLSSFAAGGSITTAVNSLNRSGFTQVSKALATAVAPASNKLADGSTFTVAKSITTKIAKHAPLNMVMSYGAKGIPLFSQQYLQGETKGVAAASLIALMKLRDVSPEGNSQDVQKQIAGIEALLNTGQMDCLAIQPLDDHSFTAITQKVMAKGIPVFTVGVQSAGNELSNFTQVSHKEGLQAAQIVVDWMKKSGKSLKVFAVSGGDPSATWAQGRMAGFIEGITKGVPGATFVNNPSNALTTSYDPSKTYDAYKAFLTGHPTVQFIENVDIGAEYADRAIKDAGLLGKIWTIGWNLSVGQLNAIDSGVQVAALDQAWAQQAAFGPVACAEYLVNHKIMPNTQELVPVTKATGTAAARKILASLAK